MDALKMNLRPEFLNRIDEVVVFHPLLKTQVSPDTRHPDGKDIREMLNARN
jgi:ATP-dependent Clp protease ATP-binding subunit ClpA